MSRLILLAVVVVLLMGCEAAPRPRPTPTTLVTNFIDPAPDRATFTRTVKTVCTNFDYMWDDYGAGRLTVSGVLEEGANLLADAAPLAKYTDDYDSRIFVGVVSSLYYALRYADDPEHMESAVLDMNALCWEYGY